MFFMISKQPCYISDIIIYYFLRLVRFALAKSATQTLPASSGVAVVHRRCSWRCIGQDRIELIVSKLNTIVPP